MARAPDPPPQPERGHRRRRGGWRLCHGRRRIRRFEERGGGSGGRWRRPDELAECKVQGGDSIAPSVRASSVGTCSVSSDRHTGRPVAQDRRSACTVPECGREVLCFRTSHSWG